jgi:uncharacterized protein
VKIGQDIRSQIEKTPNQSYSKTNNGYDFKAIVNKETIQLRENELNQLLKQLNQKGEIVSRSRSFQDLGQYKGLVKKFIQEAVQYGLDLKQSRSWNSNGQNRKLSIVETVDHKLVELTDIVLNKEKKSIDVLGKIGEIKGLLMNLYM